MLDSMNHTRAMNRLGNFSELRLMVAASKLIRKMLRIKRVREENIALHFMMVRE